MRGGDNDHEEGMGTSGEIRHKEIEEARKQAEREERERAAELERQREAEVAVAAANEDNEAREMAGGGGRASRPGSD